jgi:hypothetical protein
MLIVSLVGVKQQAVPEGEMLSHLPPLPVKAIGVKRMEVLVLATDITLGGGFTPRVVLKVTVGS